MIHPRTKLQNAKSLQLNQTPSKLQLLREVLEAVMWEFSTIKEQRWEALPELSRRKQQLLTRMSEFDWTPLPLDRENPEISIIRSQIMDLEFQIKQNLETHLGIIENQLDDLQQRHSRWRAAIDPYRKR